jgi:L-asparaginase / beta-aspartyl-peptidase
MTPSSPRFVQEGGNLARPALLVHGGAGTFERLRHGGARTRLEDGLCNALTAGWELLGPGGPALLAAVEAVVSLEDSGLFNAGRGSTPNSDGELETDASVMDGGTGAAGAVCAATWPANPIRAALAVARVALSGETNDGDGWHPLLLAGAGADRLARAAGLASMGAAPPNTAFGSRGQRPTAKDQSTGTVGAVALDAAGHVAAATSTGGRAGQPTGRVGDSPIIGAGTWADDTTVAVSATGVGEAFILAGFAHRVDWAVRSGTALDGALEAALAAVCLHHGSGGAIALAPSGTFSSIFDTAAMARGWRSTTELVVRI